MCEAAPLRPAQLTCSALPLLCTVGCSWRRRSPSSARCGSPHTHTHTHTEALRCCDTVPVRVLGGVAVVKARLRGWCCYVVAVPAEVGLAMHFLCPCAHGLFGVHANWARLQCVAGRPLGFSSILLYCTEVTLCASNNSRHIVSAAPRCVAGHARLLLAPPAPCPPRKLCCPSCTKLTATAPLCRARMSPPTCTSTGGGHTTRRRIPQIRSSHVGC